MKALEFIKSNLRETLLKGIADTLVSLKDLLPKHSEKYQSLILLESQLNDLKRQTMQGTISEESAQLARNRIRAALMDLINSIDPRDLEEQPPSHQKTATPAEPIKTSASPPKTSPINWRAELIEKDKFDRLAFQVFSNTQTHLIELLLIENTTSRLLINKQVILEEKLNFFNAVSSLFNLITTNEETLNFKLNDEGRSYPGALTYGASVSEGTYIRVKLMIDGITVYSEL